MTIRIKTLLLSAVLVAAAAKAGTEQALEHHDLLHPNTAGHLRMAYALAYQLLGYPAHF